MAPARVDQSPRLDLGEAARSLAAGGVLAYPTESCYGLGCDPGNRAAVARIWELKGREPGQGLILAGGAWQHLAPYWQQAPERIGRLLRAAWPGPVTFLLPPSSAVPEWIIGEHKRVALRWSAHPVTGALCRTFGGALVSTSANRHGEPAAVSATEVAAVFGEGLDGIVEGTVGRRRAPSAIIDPMEGRRLR